MKTLLILVLSMHLACKKSTSTCETWQIQDICIPKQDFSWCLFDQEPREVVFCNRALEGVSAGKTVILSDDENYTLTRTYIKKIN